MATFTLENTATDYNTPQDALAAAAGQNFGAPARIVVSGRYDGLIGTINQSLPNGVIFAAKAGEEFDGANSATAAGIVPSSTSGNIVVSRIAQEVRFENLVIAPTNAFGPITISADEFYTIDVVFDGCLLAPVGTSSSANTSRVVSLRTSNARTQSILFENCVLTNGSATYTITDVAGTANASLTFRKSTFVGANDLQSAGSSLDLSYGIVNVEDCYVADHPNAQITGSAANVINLATSDATAYGTGAQVNVLSTTALNDLANGDYTTKAGSSLIGAGVGGGTIGYSAPTAGVVPQGTVTIGSITQTATTASVPFTYSASDQTGFEYRLNSGTPVAVGASPASITGLTPSTAYTVEVRAVNASGSGTWSTAANFTTDAAAGNPPQGTVTIGTITHDHNSATVPFTYSDTDQTGFEYRLNGGAATAAQSSPILLSALTPEMPYDVEVRAVNASGAGAWSAVSSFTTDAAPVSGGTIANPAPCQTRTGQTYASSTFDAWVLNEATNSLVLKTQITTNSTGNFSITDNSLVSGTAYLVVGVDTTDNTQIAAQRITAS